MAGGCVSVFVLWYGLWASARGRFLFYGPARARTSVVMEFRCRWICFGIDFVCF